MQRVDGQVRQHDKERLRTGDRDQEASELVVSLPDFGHGANLAPEAAPHSFGTFGFGFSDLRHRPQANYQKRKGNQVQPRVAGQAGLRREQAIYYQARAKAEASCQAVANRRGGGTAMGRNRLGDQLMPRQQRLPRAPRGAEP